MAQTAPAAPPQASKIALAPLPQGVGNSDLQPLILQINDRLRRISAFVGGVAGDKGPEGAAGAAGPRGERGPPGNQGGITMIEETPTGTQDGTNKVFALSEAPEDVLLLFLNGVQQMEGAANDFTLNGTTITYLIAPQASDWQLAVYDSSSPGTGGIHQEIPSGAIDANNTVFTLSEAPVGFLLLFLNGIEQENGTDFTLNGFTITYTTPPQAQDAHVAVYGTSQPGADAPGRDRDIIYNRLGKYAADDNFQYDYTGLVVTLKGGAGTGFTAETFNSVADKAPTPATVAAFQTSGGDLVIYGDGHAALLYTEYGGMNGAPPSPPAGIAAIYFDAVLDNLFYNVGNGWIPFGGTALNAITVTTSPYNLAPTDGLVTLAAGANVVNFPQQSTILQRHVYYIANRSGGDCSLVPFSGDTLGGRTSLPIANGANYELIPNA
jgi:hypothetical protein